MLIKIFGNCFIIRCFLISCPRKSLKKSSQRHFKIEFSKLAPKKDSLKFSLLLFSTTKSSIRATLFSAIEAMILQLEEKYSGISLILAQSPSVTFSLI